MKKVGQQEVEIVLNGVRCLSCMQMKVTAQEEYIHEEVLNEKPLKKKQECREKASEQQMVYLRVFTYEDHIHSETYYVVK